MPPAVRKRPAAAVGGRNSEKSKRENKKKENEMGKAKSTGSSERDVTASRGAGSDRDACAFSAASRGSASKRTENFERDGISPPPQDVQAFDGQKLPAASGPKDSMDCVTEMGKFPRGSVLI